jgi:hypothetical protein
MGLSSPSSSLSSNDADNQQVSVRSRCSQVERRCVAQLRKLDGVPDGVIVGEVAFGKCLIDHHNRRGIVILGLIPDATLRHGDAQGREILLD